MEFLAIVIAVRIFYLAADLSNATFDRIFLPGTTNHDCVFTGDGNLLDAAQIAQFDSFQVDSKILENRLAIGQRCDVTKDRFATITVARSLDSSHAQNATHLVDHQSRQRISFNVFSDNQQRLLRLADCFEQRDHLLVVGDLLFMNQNVAVFQFDRHLILIGYKVRREEPSIELHTFNNFNSRFISTTFFDSDHAVLANLQKCICQNIADRWIIVARNRRDLLDFLFILCIDRNRNLVDLNLHDFDGLRNPTSKRHRVCARGDHLQAFPENRFCKNRSCSRSITSNVVRLASRFLDQLSPQVFIGVIKLDLFGNSHAVFCNFW